MKTLLTSIVLSSAFLYGWCSAEPTNAKDVRGDFVLVIGGWMKRDDGPYFDANRGEAYKQDNFRPFIVEGFTSLQHCIGAGLELKARFGHEGYDLDFVCIATGKKAHR